MFKLINYFAFDLKILNKNQMFKKFWILTLSTYLAYCVSEAADEAKDIDRI